MVKNSKFCRSFGPPCRNPLAKVNGSIPECAQVCALHTRPHLATLRKTETADSWVAIGVSHKTGSTCLLCRMHWHCEFLPGDFFPLLILIRDRLSHFSHFVTMTGCCVWWYHPARSCACAIYCNTHFGDFIFSVKTAKIDYNHSENPPLGLS